MNTMDDLWKVGREVIDWEKGILSVKWSVGNDN